MKKIITGFLGAFTFLQMSLLAQTFTGTVLFNQVKNVTSGSFTDATTFQIQNSGSANLFFFMANSATAISSSGKEIAAGEQLTVTVANLGGISTGTFVNVSNKGQLSIAGSYVFTVTGNRESVSYKTYTQTFYNFDTLTDQLQIPSQELLQMRPTDVSDFHKEYMSLDNKYTQEIEHLYNTEFLEWMTMPKKTVIDEKGVRSYDENGNVLVDLPPSDKSSKLHLEIVKQLLLKGLFAIPDFQPITEIKIEEMKLAGYTVSKTDEGEVHFRKGTYEQIINPSQYYVALIEYNDQNEEIYRIDKVYIYNENSELVPHEQAEVYNKQTSNNICYQKVIYTSYKDFTRTFGPKINSPIDPEVMNKLFGDGVRAYPNPASNMIYVELPSATSTDNQMVNITMENVFGKVVRSLNNQPAGTTVSFNVAGLLSGTYAIKVSWNGGLKTVRILKI